MENAQVGGSYLNGRGSPVFRKCSIPQGCPFSMNFLCLIMRVWVSVMGAEFPFVQVRILADDLLLASEFPPGFDPEEAASLHMRALDRTV
eukprot:611272-Alexandrium_andersonii.AAC.1